jgi:hypothetical protein
MGHNECAGERGVLLGFGLIERRVVYDTRERWGEKSLMMERWKETWVLSDKRSLGAR